MNVGIRLGAPVEPPIWTFDRIQTTYGDITDYVKYYKNFAADDDANGPVFFLRALYDDATDRAPTSEDVARAWLNYTRENKGMFWWGGYGVSTEHTVYQNLKLGIPAPASGSIAQNGATLAEQIGGQIFIDTWGLVCPGDPDKAASYGEIAARVSHDGEGVNGARFFCAAIALAFVCDDINQIIHQALAYIPENSTYFKVAQSVISFYHDNPDDFRACFHMLEQNWGYDKYTGICHIIPNAGVCILAMLYGGGDFNRTVEIATMCGWDTDCNAGNVGTVLGVMVGRDGIAPHYLAPINDSIVLSSVSGYLNILDVPTYTRELCLLGYRIAGEVPPQSLVERVRFGVLDFDFSLAGSTHNFRVSDPSVCTINHTTLHGNSLHVQVDHIGSGQGCKLFYKPYYTRQDFSDERYQPVFSPTVYSGQVVTSRLYTTKNVGNFCPLIAPYIHLVSENRDVNLGYRLLKEEDWTEIEFVIPDSNGDLIDEIGFIIEGNSTPADKTFVDLYMDHFSVTGHYHYTINFDKQRTNFGAISPFSHNRGAWEISNHALFVMSSGVADSYTGNYFASATEIKTTITPIHGDSHLLSIHAQGIERGYFAGLAPDNQLTIYLNDFGVTPIASCDFVWEHGVSYGCTLSASNGVITIQVENTTLTAQNHRFSYGMFGCYKLSMGRTAYGHFTVSGGCS